MKVYLCGNYEEPNYRLFKNLEMFIQQGGDTAINPISLVSKLESIRKRKLTKLELFEENAKALLDCDSICLLQDYEKSKDAKFLKKLAEEKGLKFIKIKLLKG